jgi:putative hydroxymethylpyrimidine transport system permease protein
MGGRIARVAGAAALAVALWQGLVWALDMPPFILPGPGRVAEALWANRALIGEHALVTGAEVLIGLVLGAALGAGTAIWLAASEPARALLRPMLVFSQAIPVFALAPVLTLWFGFFDGLTRTPQGWLDLARVMGASEGRILWRIRVPAALPSLASGLRLAAVYAPIGAIIGEWVGASRGLGYLMLLANGRAKIDLMFAALIVLAVFTMALHWAVDRGAKALLARHG